VDDIDPREIRRIWLLAGGGLTIIIVILLLAWLL
jgi:hypothetical protein